MTSYTGIVRVTLLVLLLIVCTPQKKKKEVKNIHIVKGKNFMEEPPKLVKKRHTLRLMSLIKSGRHKVCAP